MLARTRVSFVSPFTCSVPVTMASGSKGSPDWYLSSDDDTGADREYVECERCPREAQCSKAAFKKAGCWSFRGLDRCIEKTAMRFRRSSSRFLDEDEALRVAAEGNYVTKTDSKQGRAEYRQTIKKLSEQKQQHTSKVQTSHLKQLPTPSKCVELVARGGSSSDPDVVIKASRLQVLADANNRAKHACDSMARLCNGVAAQYEHEAKIFDAAAVMLDKLMVKKE